MRKIESMILFLMILNMVAEVVNAADTSGTPNIKDFNVGRAFAHCTKLTKDNYDLWFTGLLSTLIGITGVASMNGVRQFFETFEKYDKKWAYSGVRFKKTWHRWSLAKIIPKESNLEEKVRPLG